MDKRTGYDFFYRAALVAAKPALIGLLGSWIPAAVWSSNWPCHHRPSTYMPVERTGGGRRKRRGHGVDERNASLAEPHEGHGGRSTVSRRSTVRYPHEGVQRHAHPALLPVVENAAVPVACQQYPLVFPPDVHRRSSSTTAKNVTEYPVASGVYNGHSDGRRHGIFPIIRTRTSPRPISARPRSMISSVATTKASAAAWCMWLTAM